MKKIILIFSVSTIFPKFGFTQTENTQPKICVIPQPVSVDFYHGHFLLKTETADISADRGAADVASFLSTLLHENYGFPAKQNGSKNISSGSSFFLTINKSRNKLIGDEGYNLKVTQQKVMLSANTPKGLFYGIQTLIQLLPPKNDRYMQKEHNELQIPCLDLTDYPRFGYRGIMLDVSRHFFTKELIKKYIDEMAKYKYNVFHWHLTDDQGWRIEIKGLPELTKVGAWRVGRTGEWGTFLQPQPGEKAIDGGYYTQDDIREIVQYAKQRFVDILPEIDVPAHSLALIAAYPNLSCTKRQYYVSPQYAPDSLDDVLCVANDSTWIILDKILTQVAQLFPYQYIHTGGDEANRKFWTNDAKDVALMKKEGLSAPAQLQSYFEKKLEKLIISKGKKMIGWDEIVEGGLAPEAVVMSWRGMKGGIEAAKMGHEVIMAPILQTYLSRKQGDPSVEPFGPGILRLSTSYEFEPIPEGVEPKFILGGQASIWTEKIPNFRHLEYMTWPRAMAIAEVLWSPKTTRDWDNFAQRAEEHFKYLEADSVKYSRSMYDPIITAVKGDDDSIKIKMITEMPSLTIYYTFDGTNPDNFYPEYPGVPLDIPKGASEIRAVAYRNGKVVSSQINKFLDDLKKALEKRKN